MKGGVSLDAATAFNPGTAIPGVDACETLSAVVPGLSNGNDAAVVGE